MCNDWTWAVDKPRCKSMSRGKWSYKGGSLSLLSLLGGMVVQMCVLFAVTSSFGTSVGRSVGRSNLVGKKSLVLCKQCMQMLLLEWLSCRREWYKRAKLGWNRWRAWVMRPCTQQSSPLSQSWRRPRDLSKTFRYVFQCRYGNVTSFFKEVGENATTQTIHVITNLPKPKKKLEHILDNPNSMVVVRT